MTLLTHNLPEAPAATASLAVRTVDLYKSIDERPILRGVDLEIETGAFTAILGANGAGKSTLLRIIATLTSPSAGELYLFGERARWNSVKLRARIGMICDQSMLYRDLSARENLEFFARLYGLSDAVPRARKALDMIGMSRRANDPVKSFSRGMTQRVAVARALIHDPELILADEPFAGLDAPSIASLETLFAELCDQNKTVVIVNHDIEQSLRIATRAIVLRAGKVVVDEPTGRLYAKEILSEVTQ
jgi:heme exporter protein A